jgi:hypothetical protein
MRREPLAQRKASLERVLAPAEPGLRFNEHLDEEGGPLVFHHACKLGLEGIVSKRRNLPWTASVCDTDRIGHRWKDACDCASGGLALQTFWSFMRALGSRPCTRCVLRGHVRRRDFIGSRIGPNPRNGGKY